MVSQDIFNKVINSKLFCNSYILLWLVYSMQTVVFGRAGTVYSQAIVLYLTIVSLYFTIYSFCYYKIPIYLKGLSIFLCMIALYGVLFILYPTVSSKAAHESIQRHTYLLLNLNSLMPIFPFYVFTRQGNLTKISLQRWTLVFFFVATIQYSQHQQQQLYLATLQGSNREEFINGVGYEFLAIIPLLAFCNNRKTLQYIGLLYIMAFILYGMKRGAILTGSVCVIWFLFISFKNAKRSKKFAVIILSVIFIAIAYFIVQHLLSSSDFFMYRYEITLEGNSSGRDVIYKTLLGHFLNETNPLIFLFGNGANGTLLVFKQYAHNDWLEIVINQGLMGLIVYLFYWICFYKSTRKARFDEEVFLAVSLLLISNFLRSFFSMSYGDMSTYATICLGFCMGKISEFENQK